MIPHAPIIKVKDEFELRIPIEEDSYQLARVVDENREYLMTWLPWLESSRNQKDSLLYIQKIHGDWTLHKLYSCLLYKENEIVGAMGFHSRSHKYMPMGYWISKKYAGTGLCTVASRALIKWAFSYYEDLNMIELKAAADNLPSRRVAEKLGFKCEAVLRNREWLYNRFVDHAVYSLTRKEFARENN